jgi:predicted CXXCH cytochrome family protein
MESARTSRKRLLAVPLMIGVVIVGAAQLAGAGYAIPPAALSATGPCLFSEQLQSSASARKDYMTKLVAVSDGGVTARNSVEQMYGSIKPASYSEDDGKTEPEPSIWGLDTIQDKAPSKIDTLSSDCLNCHDGVGAVPVTVVLRNNPYDRTHRGLPSSDHPIGMDYNRYASFGKGFRALFGLPNTGKMILVNGKVGCLTCHNPLNPEKGHLVMSDRESALCLTCHNK